MLQADDRIRLRADWPCSGASCACSLRERMAVAAALHTRNVSFLELGACGAGFTSNSGVSESQLV